MKENRRWYLLISVLLTAIILFIKEGETLFRLNSVFFGNYHDALKNYYTVLYHIKWDEGYRLFEGMNYPFGEHVLFTDNQPLLSGILKFIHENLFPIAKYTLGIINSAMFIGMLLATLFTHLCLQKLGVKKYLAIAVAVALTFLSPQVGRINGHFALSYSFIIPLLFYQGLLFIESPRLKRSSIIAITIIGISFLHAYYFGFGLVIFSGLFLVSLFYRNLSWKTGLMHFAMQVLLPLVLVEMIMVFSDTVVDRPSYPWSPFINNFKAHGIFFPLGKPLGAWIGTNFGLPQVEWESITYVGAFASLFLLLGVLTLPFFLVFRKARQHWLINSEQKMNFLLVAGLAALLISILYSVLSGNVDIYQLMGPFRQFRAVTRFNWVLFVALNLYAFAWLSKKLKQLKPFWQWVIPLSIVAVLTYDAYWQSHAPYHTEHQIAMMFEDTNEQLEMEQKLSPYDVFIPVPYFHIGSEDFALLRGDDQHYKNSMAISYASGLPMTAVMLSRTSLNQTLQNLAYTLTPRRKPAFAQYLENKRVLLLVRKGQQYTEQESLILEAGTDTVLNKESFYLQEFSLIGYIENFRATQPGRKYVDIDMSAGLLAYENYEEDTAHAFLGEGGYSIPVKEPRTLDEFTIELENQKPLKLGLWVYLYQQTKAPERFRFRFLDANRNELSMESYSIRDGLKAIDGHWGYVEYELSPPTSSFTLEVFQDRNTLNPTPTFVDALRITQNPENNEQTP